MSMIHRLKRGRKCPRCQSHGVQEDGDIYGQYSWCITCGWNDNGSDIVTPPRQKQLLMYAGADLLKQGHLLLLQAHYRTNMKEPSFKLECSTCSPRKFMYVKARSPTSVATDGIRVECRSGHVTLITLDEEGEPNGWKDSKMGRPTKA